MATTQLAHSKNLHDDIDVAKLIREYRALFLVAKIGTLAKKSSIEVLVAAINWATSPTLYATDREHRTLRRFSKWARQRLNRLSPEGSLWYESDNGHLWNL